MQRISQMSQECLNLYKTLVKEINEYDTLNVDQHLSIIGALIWNIYKELGMSPTHIANEIECLLEIYIVYDEMERNSKTQSPSL